MKKWILIYLIFLPPFLFGGDIKKPKKDYPNVKFGATAGLNYSNVIITNAANLHTFLLGWNIGGYSVINFSDKLSFEPELLYTLKGATLPVGGGVSYYSRDKYVEIPLQLKVRLSNHIVLLGGPYVGYYLGYSSDFYSSFPNAGTSTFGGSYWDIGGTLSLGYELKNGFNAGIRIEREFNNRNNPQYTPKIYNEVGIVYLGWTFVKFRN